MCLEESEADKRVRCRVHASRIAGGVGLWREIERREGMSEVWRQWLMP